MFSIRQAIEADIEVMIAFDDVAQRDSSRRAFIQRTVGAGSCFVALAGKQVVGYIVLEYSFYEEGFVAMLYIHPDYRHQGAGEMLMQYIEPLCRTAKLFASTNFSNQRMQALFAKLGYALSGVIYNLDEGDPELVYFKAVGAARPSTDFAP